MKNNINLKYFKVSLKRGISFALFNIIIFTISYILPIIFNVRINNDTSVKYGYDLSTRYGYLIALLAVYAIVVPVKALGYFTKKKHIDTYYSLPIKRSSLLLIHLLTNMINVLIPFSIVYFTGSIITLIFYPKVQYIYYLIFYLLIIFVFALYTMFNSFFFTRANKVLDGIVTVIFANFALTLIFISIFWLLETSVNDVIYASIPFSSFIKYGNYFNKLIVAKYDYHDYLYNKHYLYDGKQSALDYQEWCNDKLGSFNFKFMLYLLILGVIAAVLLFIFNKKRKPEIAEEVSDSWFGLKILSPIIFTCLTVIISARVDVLSSLLLFNFVAIGYLGTTVLERKTFKLPLYKIFILLGMFTLIFFIK